MPDGVARSLQALFARDAVACTSNDIGGRQKNVDARVRRSLQRLPCAVDVARAGASQAGDDGGRTDAAIFCTA